MIPLNKLCILFNGYKKKYDGGLTINYGPTMIYLLLKFINKATRIRVYNIKYEIYKETL